MGDEVRLTAVERLKAIKAVLAFAGKEIAVVIQGYVDSDEFPNTLPAHDAVMSCASHLLQSNEAIKLAIRELSDA